MLRGPPCGTGRPGWSLSSCLADNPSPIPPLPPPPLPHITRGMRFCCLVSSPSELSRPRLCSSPSDSGKDDENGSCWTEAESKNEKQKCKIPTKDSSLWTVGEGRRVTLGSH